MVPDHYSCKILTTISMKWHLPSNQETKILLWPLWLTWSIPKLQWLYHWSWSLGKDKSFHPTLYNICNYLSMLRLKLNNLSKKGPRPDIVGCLQPQCCFSQSQATHVLPYTFKYIPFIHNNMNLPEPMFMTCQWVLWHSHKNNFPGFRKN